MNKEITIYTAARIQALEYLVGHLYAMHYAQSAYSLDQVKAVNDAMIAKVAAHSIENTSAAMSDHYVAELTAGVKDVLDRVLSTLATAAAQSSGQR